MMYSGDEDYGDEITSPNWRDYGPEDRYDIPDNTLDEKDADKLVARLAERLADEEVTVATVAEWNSRQWLDALSRYCMEEYEDRFTSALEDRTMARMLRNQVEDRNDR